MAKKPSKNLSICRELGLPDDTPIYDAKKDLEITVERQDVRTAKPRDPLHCGYANAICRQTGAPAAAVRRWATYIATERYGKPAILRYITSHDMRIILSRFDRTEKMAAHTEVLKAPTLSCQLETMARYQRKRKADIKAGKRDYNPTGPQRPHHPINNLRPRLGALAE